MKKIIYLILISTITLSGCAYLRTHKLDVEQGNIISQEQVAMLHRGMTEGQVKNIMGAPLLVNVFTPGRIDYIYTFQAGYGERKDKRLICIFSHGRLQEILQS